MTTSLARLPQVFVSARGATTSDALQNLPSNEIAEQLGVRYLLQASVQGAPNRFRVSARLDDTRAVPHAGVAFTHFQDARCGWTT
ncbi:hypothetical protein [Ruegeria marina]|nr:hypothetical protein [Ruegeria marina]